MVFVAVWESALPAVNHGRSACSIGRRLGSRALKIPTAAAILLSITNAVTSAARRAMRGSAVELIPVVVLAAFLNVPTGHVLAEENVHRRIRKTEL